MPAGNRKDKLINSSPQQRLDMINLILKSLPQDINIKSNDIEVKNEESIKSYDLLNLLSQ